MPAGLGGYWGINQSTQLPLASSLEPKLSHPTNSLPIASLQSPTATRLAVFPGVPSARGSEAGSGIRIVLRMPEPAGERAPAALGRASRLLGPLPGRVSQPRGRRLSGGEGCSAGVMLGAGVMLLWGGWRCCLGGGM